MNLLWFLLIGLIAGWLATLIMKGPRLSLLGSLLLGVVGALLGGFMFRLLGIAAYSLLGSLITATIGAVAAIWLAGFIRRA